MPSIYYGCQIQDEISDALRVYRGELERIKKQTNDEATALAVAVQRLSSNKTKASATIGAAANDQVLWQAVDSGSAGNQISITYIYLGPDSTGGVLAARPASSYVIGDTTIYCVLPVDITGAISGTTIDALNAWLLTPEVAALVTGIPIGTGLDAPTIQPQTFLSDGKGSPLSDAETAAHDISKAFGYSTYQDLLKAADVPVVESADDAAKYLRSQNENFVIINGKLLIVEGTNLNGINALYDLLSQDLDKLKSALAHISANGKLPTYITTQNVETTTQELVCGELQTFVTVAENYRSADTPLPLVASQWASGNASVINNYWFWGTEVTATQATRYRVINYGMPEPYVSDILTGVSPEQDVSSQVLAPTVYLVEEPTLFNRLGLSDAEIKLLLAEKVSGVRIPGSVSFSDREKALDDVTNNDRFILANGLRSALKKPIAAAQAINAKDSLAEDDLAKELATRGKACARQSKNFNTSTPAFPNLDLPNMPTADLPVSAEQIESAFGALSNIINTASGIFDAQIKAVMGAVEGLLNKLSNLSSLAENLLKNDLLQCLLGTDGQGTGLPDIPGVGSGAPGGIALGGSGGVGAPTLGGIPLPTSLLVDALKELSTSLDETITSAFESLMDLIRTPLCQMQNLISSIVGFDLGGVENPCKSGKDLDTSCPAGDTQDIINASTEMSSSLSGMNHLADVPTQKTTQQVEQSVQEFSGEVQKTVTTVTNTIDRGVKKVMEDIQKSLDSKLKFLDRIDKAVRELTGEVRETKVAADEQKTATTGCSPPSLGLFTDAISEFL